MMKKLVLFVFAMMVVMTTMAQNRNVFLNESFDGEVMPEGWSIMELGTANWSISHTDNAGGIPNEVKFTYTPTFDGVSRLVTPPLDLTGVESVMFSFKFAFVAWLNSHVLGIATTSDGGATWHEAWSETFSEDVVSSIVEEVATVDMGQPNVQFCIFYSGHSLHFEKWYFDDIQIYTLEQLDLSLSSIHVAEVVPAGGLTVGINVENQGVETVTTVEASFEVDDQERVVETFEVDIPSHAEGTLYFNHPANLSPGDHNLSCRINLVNGEEDGVASNNECSMSVNAVFASPDRKPMIEHFSSSTCTPCVEVNEAMAAFCEANPGRFTYTKYQMNYPGGGDPYYTPECRVRGEYYHILGVPKCYLDAVDQYDAIVKQSVFEQHALQPAMMDVRGAFSVDGTVVTVSADIMPYIDTEARVYISVNEKETFGNVGTNGETVFHHIMMKMLPDAEGSTVSFVNGEVQHFEFSYDMALTHVEEMSDLEVAIWVQDYDTKEVFNSRYAFEYTEEHPYPVEGLMLTQDEQANENTMVVSWDTPNVGTPMGYDVYVNGVLVADNIAERTFAFSGESNLYYLVGVRAVYADDKTSVLSLAELTNTWSLDEVQAPLCMVYPNPANTQVCLEAEQGIESVMIYDEKGALLKMVLVNGKTVSMDLGSYHDGVYFFIIRLNDGMEMMKRVVVTH